MKLLIPASLLISLARAQELAQCGLYLAQSSTASADDHKWGLYAGTEIPKGATIGNPEIAIHTLNIKGSHVMTDGSTSLAETSTEFFEQYIWVPDASGGKFDVSKGRIVTAIAGPGVLGALNVKLTNADWNHLSAYQRPSMGESPGVPHVGRGAYSTFYHATLTSKDSILAGTEIFLDYGENWEDSSDEAEELTKADYSKIDTVVHQILDFMDKYKGELDETQKTEIYDFLVKDILAAAAGSQKGKLIASLLPATPDELLKVKEGGGSLLYSVPSAKRSMEWLQENGRCMDNLKVGASSIENAGRGAFTQRPLKEGSIVSPVPLVHIPDKSAMDMYEVEQSRNDDDELFWHRTSTKPYSKQLLLNYCYGHPKSNLLFFPAGSMSSFINHSPTPNVKLVWSEHSHHRKDWYELSPATLLTESNYYLGLMMEVVAIRDLEEGEEVFLDYGSEWQAAWDDHAATWTKSLENGDIPNPWPIRALDLNDEFKDKGFRTKAELEMEPYPETIRQMCFLIVQNIPDEQPHVKSWAMTKKEGTTFDTDNLFDCTVVERIAVESPFENSLAFNYTIQWMDKERNEVTIVRNVPHLAITFLDKPDTGDQWVTKNPFRHFIGIPDEVFPQGPWRDASL